MYSNIFIFYSQYGFLWGTFCYISWKKIYSQVVRLKKYLTLIKYSIRLKVLFSVPQCSLLNFFILNYEKSTSTVFHFDMYSRLLSYANKLF